MFDRLRFRPSILEAKVRRGAGLAATVTLVTATSRETIERQQMMKPSEIDGTVWWQFDRPGLYECRGHVVAARGGKEVDFLVRVDEAGEIHAA